MSLKESNAEKYRFRLHLLHPRYWLTWLALAVYFLLTLLPLSIVDWAGCKLGSFAARKNKKRFNIVKTNLSLCYPEKNSVELEQMVVQNFQAQFRSILHYFILWWRPEFLVRKRICSKGFEQITHYQQQGKNIIILLVHTAGLEFAVAAISMGRPANGPYKEIRNPVINWIIANGRLRFGKRAGGKLFTREDGLKPLIRETRKGKVLIYLADEDLGEKHSVFVPFFGVQKATIPLLGRLAKSCDAVVLPCVSCYQPENRQYIIELLPKIEDMSGDNIEADSISMNKAIEAAIGECPLQYLWSLRYFQTRPPGEKSLYD
jgi:lipid A biosynthesis lauroyl/palmitoleoyl acyltransferase